MAKKALLYLSTITRPLVIVLAVLSGHISMLAEEWKSNNVTIYYETRADGSVLITRIVNYSGKPIIPEADNKQLKQVNDSGGYRPNIVAYSSFGYNFSKAPGDKFIIPKLSEDPNAETPVDTIKQQANLGQTEPMKQETKDQSSAKQTDRIKGGASRPRAEVNLYALVERDTLLSSAALSAMRETVNNYLIEISKAESPKEIIQERGMIDYLEVERALILGKTDTIPSIAHEIAMALINNKGNKPSYNEIVDTLNNRLNLRKVMYNELNTVVSKWYDNAPKPISQQRTDIINYSIVAALILIILIWLIVAFVRRKQKTAKSRVPQSTTHKVPTGNPDNSGDNIVVRRKTTSILKTQNIDDVVGNPSYLLIETLDFVPDSAVRNIYIKNTCIKEIYNMYADDLRDESKPNEDGCMVLGRWILDKATGLYDVTLESVVLPGDDAVFQEYELNFGGKIKLRVAEKLRKMRKESNLQYDLTCWVHSHPQLTVFFSNFDSSVHEQLKHPQHPNFLTAIVVDILTADQELGIFTFRPDGTIISRTDLTRLYSLEEMYRWAVDSVKQSYEADSHYNLLHNAKAKKQVCGGIELNNNAIIDLAQVLDEPVTGLVGWCIGYDTVTPNGTEYIIGSVVADGQKPHTGAQGAVVSVTLMSLPTIQRFIAGIRSDIKFVLVYSTKDRTITSIPLDNGKLTTDDSYYGDVNIDDLKIWTRRRR